MKAKPWKYKINRPHGFYKKPGLETIYNTEVGGVFSSLLCLSECFSHALKTTQRLSDKIKYISKQKTGTLSRHNAQCHVKANSVA